MKSYAPLGALCLLACASQKSAESHSDYTGKVDTVRTEGAERVTVLEFAPSAQPSGFNEKPPVAEAERGGGLTAALKPPFGTLPEHGPLIKATITETGPITTTTKASADAHADAESASKRSWFQLGFLAWAGIAAGAVLALLLAWKFRSGLLGSALKLIGKG